MGIQVYSNEGPHPISKGKNSENTCTLAKLTIFSRTTGPFSMKLGTEHPGVNGVSSLFNQRILPYFQGDIIKNSENTCTLMKFKNLLQTIGPILTKLGTMHPWLKGIQVCSNDGSFNCHIEKKWVFSRNFQQKISANRWAASGWRPQFGSSFG